MAEAKKSDDIGMKRGRVLPNLPQSKQLDVIAEGLPILMKSVGDLQAASKALGEHHRAATILEGHAIDEVAKILILIDIVRCPPKLRPSRIGPMMTWLYDHLARLIYIDAQGWNAAFISHACRNNRSVLELRPQSCLLHSSDCARSTGED